MVSKIRKTKSGIKQLLIPGMFFEEMGIVYLGPVDGGDLHGIVKLSREASHIDGPVLIHVMTHRRCGVCTGRETSCKIPRNRTV